MINHLITKIMAENVDPDSIKVPGIGDQTKADLNTIYTFITGIIDIALNVATIICVIMIMYSAFLYATAYGEESKAETAKKTLLWSAVGLFITVGSMYLVGFISKNLGYST